MTIKSKTFSQYRSRTNRKFYRINKFLITTIFKKTMYNTNTDVQLFTNNRTSTSMESTFGTRLQVTAKFSWFLRPKMAKTLLYDTRSIGACAPLASLQLEILSIPSLPGNLDT